MYKLTFSPASPYVRKVLLSAYSAGIEGKIELITADSQDNSLLRSQNPLGKIPILQKPDGFFYSIVEWLLIISIELVVVWYLWMDPKEISF